MSLLKKEHSLCFSVVGQAGCKKGRNAPFTRRCNVLFWRGPPYPSRRTTSVDTSDRLLTRGTKTSKYCGASCRFHKRDAGGFVQVFCLVCLKFLMLVVIHANCSVSIWSGLPNELFKSWVHFERYRFRMDRLFRRNVLWNVCELKKIDLIWSYRGCY